MSRLKQIQMLAQEGTRIDSNITLKNAIRLLDGDLVQVGEALIKGLRVRHYEGNCTEFGSLDFSCQASSYEIMGVNNG